MADHMVLDEALGANQSKETAPSLRCTCPHCHLTSRYYYSPFRPTAVCLLKVPPLDLMIHPEQDRIVSIRELARIQGFPDRVVFHGAPAHMIKQIGNGTYGDLQLSTNLCSCSYATWRSRWAGVECLGCLCGLVQRFLRLSTTVQRVLRRHRATASEGR